MYKTVMASSFVFAQRPTYALHYCKTSDVLMNVLQVLLKQLHPSLFARPTNVDAV